MDYKPLEDYGVIGNLETVALVGRDGAIDWCCFPHADSPSVFAGILDNERGGHFTVQPTGTFEGVQRYVDRTNVLETRFHTASGEATLTDFMPVPSVAGDGGARHRTIYRHVACESGPMDLRVDFEPRLDYARTTPRVEAAHHGVVAAADDATEADEAVFLSSSVPLRPTEHGADAEVTLSEGDSRWLVLGYDHEVPVDPAAHRRVRDGVVRYWREWAHDCPDGDGCPVGGPWHSVAVRSALTLKLLIYHESGAICAAPTTSLPEDVGGVRNWDYRYNWIRDAAFSVRALAEMGHLEEAKDYFSLCLDHCSRGDPADIHPAYSLRGGPVPDEETLDHLSGYRDSAPVRVGNAAGDQYQLDVYGELIHGIYATSLYGETIGEGDWDVMRGMIDYVCDAWRSPDAGIWETRTDHEQFVYSKVMCWVALDRGLRIVEETGFDGPVERWEENRRAIRDAVLEAGYSETANSFVRAFGDEDRLDATSLLVPTVGFLPFDDARVQSTIDAALDRLLIDDGLVARYEGDDGLPGDEGAFLLCSFWLVTALARSGRRAEAREIYEDALEHASSLGLLAEEVDPETGEQRGNFPQAFSHIGLVNGALSLEEARAATRAESDPLGTGGAPAERVGPRPTARRSDDEVSDYE